MSSGEGGSSGEFGLVEGQNRGTALGHQPHWQILMIEDDLALRPVVLAILQRLNPGVRLDWRTSVDQVLIEIKLNWRALRAYNLIITDISLPGAYNGLELWRHCRFSCPNVPFLIISGMSLKKLEAEVLTHGTLPTFLPKPLEPTVVASVVKKLLHANGGALLVP